MLVKYLSSKTKTSDILLSEFDSVTDGARLDEKIGSMSVKYISEPDEMYMLAKLAVAAHYDACKELGIKPAIESLVVRNIIPRVDFRFSFISGFTTKEQTLFYTDRKLFKAEYNSTILVYGLEVKDKISEVSLWRRGVYMADRYHMVENEVALLLSPIVVKPNEDLEIMAVVKKDIKDSDELIVHGMVVEPMGRPAF